MEFVIAENSFYSSGENKFDRLYAGEWHARSIWVHDLEKAMKYTDLTAAVVSRNLLTWHGYIWADIFALENGSLKQGEVVFPKVDQPSAEIKFYRFGDNNQYVGAVS